MFSGTKTRKKSESNTHIIIFDVYLALHNERSEVIDGDAKRKLETIAMPREYIAMPRENWKQLEYHDNP
jgi:hypothetical protein